MWPWCGADNFIRLRLQQLQLHLCLTYIVCPCPVNSIWSPLAWRQWWNHIGDDTALCGITSAMIRRQPDHLNCPSPYPFPPFNHFPFQSDPFRTVTMRPCLCYLPASTPGKADKSARVLWVAVQVPQYMVLRKASSDTTAETSNQFTDGGGSRHSTGLYTYETLSNKR